METTKNLDEIFEDKANNIFTTLKNDYFENLKLNKQNWVISDAEKKAHNKIKELAVGYPGGVIEINHFISDILQGFENYYYEKAITPKISEYLPEIKKIQNEYIKQDYKTDIKPDYLQTSNEKDWVDLCAENHAYNKFMWFLDAENKKLIEQKKHTTDNNAKENNPIKEKLNEIEKTVANFFDRNYWEYYKKNIEPEFLKIKVGKNMCLIKEKEGELKWNAIAEAIVAVIMIIEEYGYIKKFSKKRPKVIHFDLRRAFGNYYHIKLSQADKPQRREKIKIDFYKNIFPFIITIRDIDYNAKYINK